MSDTTGSTMINVPVGQYLIEEMPVSRYECYGIEVVGAATDNVKVKSAASDTKTSKFIFDNSKYELNSTTYKAFCDLTGAVASEEVLVFRVKYDNRIKRYDSFSEVTFADNRIPGKEYVTAFKPIYTPLVTVNNGTADYTYEIDLAAALANGKFEGILTYNTGKTTKLTSADLTSNIAFNNTHSTPIKSVVLDGTTLKVTVENPVSLAGQSISLDVGYAKGLTGYDINNTSMVRGTLNLTFSEVQADSRKRLILKNDAGNSSWFGEDATNGKTSISLAFIKSAADGSTTSDPATITGLSVESGYEFKYWYLLGRDGRPILDKTTGEVMQFSDYTAIQNYIFDGTLPGESEFKDDDKYLKNVDKINGFTFQAEVGKIDRSRAKIVYTYNKASAAGIDFAFWAANGQRNQLVSIERIDYNEGISVMQQMDPDMLNLLSSAPQRFVQRDNVTFRNATTHRAMVISEARIKDETNESEYPLPVYAITTNSNNVRKMYWFSEEPHPLLSEDCHQMFHNYQYLTKIDIGDWNTSEVTNMKQMFHNTYRLHDLSFAEGFDTKHVTNMSQMFENVGREVSANVSDPIDFKPLQHWNTANVTDMSHIFENSEWNNGIGRYRINMDFSDWDLSNVTTLNGAFRDNHWSSSTDVVYKMGGTDDYKIPPEFKNTDWVPVKFGGNLSSVTNMYRVIQYVPMDQRIIQNIIGTWKLSGSALLNQSGNNVKIHDGGAYATAINGTYTTADGVTVTIANGNGQLTFP